MRPVPQRWLVGSCLTVLLVGLLVLLVRVDRRSSVPLASNGVGVGAVIATLPTPGDNVCVSPAPVPAGTHEADLWLGYHQPVTAPVPVRFTGQLRLAGGPSIPLASAPLTQSNGWVTLTLARPVLREQLGRVCVTRVGGAAVVDIVGASVGRTPTDGAGPVVRSAAGKQLAALGGAEPSLRFYSANRGTERGLSRTGAMLRHTSNLSPSGLGPTGIALVLFVLFPAGLLLLLWALISAPRRRLRTLVALCVLGSLAITTTWATVTPIFQGPDEPEHFAYAQSVAVAHRRADLGQTTRPPFSSQESEVYALLRTNANVFESGARQPWTATTRRAVNATSGLARGDGGGYTISASGHSALYYALLAPAIDLAGHGLPAQLWAARLMTALMAALIAGFAVLAGVLLQPGRKRLGALAGLAVATLPTAGYIGGVVNNDTLVNLCGAISAVVAIALLTRRGGRWAFAAAGVVGVLLPLAKITGFSMAGLLALAVLLAAVRAGGWWPALRSLLIAGGAAVATMLLFALFTHPLGQAATLVNQHPAVTGAAAATPRTLPKTLAYMFQVFFPFIHIGGDQQPHHLPLYRIYVLGTFGGFGWERFYLPTSLNEAIGLGLFAGVVAGVVAVARHWTALLGKRLAVAYVALAPIAVISFVAYAYATPGGYNTPPEHGRYLFPALVPIGLWFAAVPGVVRSGRVRAVLIGGIGGGMVVLCTTGLVVALAGFAA